MKNLSICLLSICAAALLSGCAASNRHSGLHHEREYQNDWSRARNITKMFGFGDIQDQRAPKDFDVVTASDGSILTDSLAVGTWLWSDAIHSAGVTGVLPGTTNWTHATFIGLGFALFDWLNKGTPHEARLGLFGYYPADKAPDRGEARTLFVENFATVVKKAMQEQFPDSQVFAWPISGDRQILDYRIVIELKDESLGCAAWTGTQTDDERCAVVVWGNKKRYRDTAQTPSLTNPLFGPSFSAYRFFPESDTGMYTIGGTKQAIDWAAVFFRMAPNMPPYTFSYIKAMKGPKGVNPPALLEKDRINLFIRPEQ
ncbi:MAG: hypothetical protein Q4E62_05155 [Sutterellaceae bacterium]|nr:hypothetical protein [Sutterellaceae bacterium]